MALWSKIEKMEIYRSDFFDAGIVFSRGVIIIRGILSRTAHTSHLAFTLRI